MELNVHEIDWALVMAKIARAGGGRARPIIYKIGETIPAVFTKYGILSRNRSAHFLAQSCLETDYFKTLEEYASGKAYEGRADLGNTKPGYGVKYKGRGIFQNTGFANYTRVRDAFRLLGLKVDPVTKPEVLEDPVYATWAAGIWWSENGVAKYADANDPVKMSRAINRGSGSSKKAANHEADRVKLTKAALQILANPPLLKDLAEPPRKPVEAPSIIVATIPTPEAPMPSTPIPEPVSHELTPPLGYDAELEALQKRLRDLGYYQIGKVDGFWGARSRGAIAAFKEVNDLDFPEAWSARVKAAIWSVDAKVQPVSEERKNTTADDLRQQGSQTVRRADKIRFSEVLQVGMAAIEAIAIAWQRYETTPLPFGSDLLFSIAGTPAWIAPIAQFGLALYSAAKANDVIASRLRAEQTGMHNGEPDPAPSPPTNFAPEPGTQAPSIFDMFRRK